MPNVLQRALDPCVAELSTRTFCTFRSELSSPRQPPHVAARNVVKRLSDVNEPSMIILMTTLRRPQQRYDHRLRELVRGTTNVTIATDFGVPRSTARGWLRETPKVVVSLDATNLTTSELQQEIVALRRRVRKLTALLRLALALLRSSDSACRTSDCASAATKPGSCERWIAPASLCRCGHSCGSSDCRRAGSMRGDGSSTRVRLTISRPVLTRRPVV
jgi:hypothetical protein